MKHESDSYTNCNWRTWNGSQRIRKRTGKIGKQEKLRSSKLQHF